MKTSIATVSISGDLPEKFEAIAAAGFDGVEIFENDLLAFNASPAEIGTMVRDVGLQITLYQPFRDFEGMPEPQRSRAFERAERKFDVMQELGTDLMLVCSNVSPLALGGISRASDDLRELGERAAKRKLRIGYEALAWGRHINDHRDAWEIVRRANHPNLGLILDSFHTLARNIELDSIRTIPGDRIFFVQLADAPKISMDLLHLSRHFRNMPGEGELPILDFMRAVAATGYDAPISLEIFNDRFRSGSSKLISIDGHRSLVSLMDQVRRTDPEIAIDVTQIPARAPVKGIEFVEFSANPEGANSLSTLLVAMGFRAVAHHKSKSVTRYKQGDANIIINTERSGLAHSAFLMHGTSAYAMGFKVEDVALGFERALALGAEPFSQATAPGELDVTALRGVGGNLIYLIDDKTDDVWDVEFDPFENDAEQVSAGLTRIDHIAQTVRADEFSSWLLFYTSIFDLKKTPSVDIVDPGGIVSSQVVQSDEGELRITMNGAENGNTMAGRFISESFGSGIQHIALATDDIFATATRLKQNGFEPLIIPRNYYDDVETRFGLDPAFVERLVAENILYDSDEDGEYFQFYSSTFGEGVFFEIVERRGGYQGFGAPNALFRIAVQRRHMKSKEAANV